MNANLSACCRRAIRYVDMPRNGRCAMRGQQGQICSMLHEQRPKPLCIPRLCPRLPTLARPSLGARRAWLGARWSGSSLEYPGSGRWSAIQAINLRGEADATPAAPLMLCLYRKKAEGPSRTISKQQRLAAALIRFDTGTARALCPQRRSSWASAKLVRCHDIRTRTQLTSA